MPQATFRADLHAEELIHERISACDKAFQEGDLVAIKYSIIAWENWVLGEGLGDEACLLELKKIEEDWKKAYEAKLEIYKEESKGSLCPDVMDKPKTLQPLEFWRAKYITMWSVCQRKKMLFKTAKRVSY